MGRNFWRQARKFRIKHFFRSRVPRYDRFGKICSTLSMTKTNSEDRNDREQRERHIRVQKRLERNRVNAEILNGRLYLLPIPSCFFRGSNRIQNRRFNEDERVEYKSKHAVEALSRENIRYSSEFSYSWGKMVIER